MSQQPPKKSGSRDINDLKARLGLKKGTAPAPVVGGAAPPPPGRATAAQPAVVPPPGLAVPPPPGAGPAAPPAPVVPNAADDPFGAMNAMAQMGAAQRAPEVIVIDHGKPVESVSAGTRAATIGKYAAIALIPFILGIAIRGISKDAAFYNAGIQDAKFIRKDVNGVKKTLAGISQKVDASKGSGKAATDALRELEKLEPKDAIVFKAKQNNLNPELSAKILEFYAMVAQLRLMVDDHLKSAKADDAALGTAREATEKMTLPPNSTFEKGVRVRYGVLVWNPTEEEAAKDSTPFGARIVEIGPPYCEGGKLASGGTCPEGAVETLAYRTSPTGQWQKGDFAIPGQNIEGGAAIPPKKLLIISPTGIFDGLVQTNPGTAAEQLYNKRIDAIRKKLAETVEAGNALEAKLGPKANESPHFTFFM